MAPPRLGLELSTLLLGYVNQALGAKVSRFPRGDRDTVLGEIALWYCPLLWVEQVPNANYG